MASRNHPDRRRRLTISLGFVVMLFLLISVPAEAQVSIVPQDPGKPEKTDKPDFGSHENEMRARLILKEEKKRYDEHLERAREVSQLATQLCESYQSHQAFVGEDNKKLERLEKLTKRIRNEAGGSETDVDVKDVPNNLPEAIKRIVEMAEDLRKLVEKTPRHVISAAVIDHANKLVGVIQYVRNPARHGS
ncbi:MAG: hypothetical protein AABM67_19935 [Acidobacteriota bacterium]